MRKTTSGGGQPCRSRIVLGLMAGLLSMAVAMPAMAQVTPPNLTVCEGVTCENLPESVCSTGGYKITLQSFTPGSGTTSGSTSYTYEVCSPPLGVCSGTVRNGEACSDNSFCQKQGQNEDPSATCSRQCAVDAFRGISHFDVTFPELGTSACLSGTTQGQVTGSCAISVNTSGSASVGSFDLGDGSCFGTPGNPEADQVAKCDSTTLNPGDCLTMTVNIAGETNGLGLGATVVVDKDANVCNASCIAGPSCDKCNQEPPGSQCLTKTIGFWGTHPWITNDYDPVTVCGKRLVCDGADDGKSDPSCLAGSCTSIMEGLGSVGGELPKNSAYVAFIKQLTAAKLNLNATAALFNGASCGSWTYNGNTIQEWIAACEGDGINTFGVCTAPQSTVSGSGCIEALDAFNNSQDTGFTVTPSPFDRPPVDDHDNVSGADPSQFTKAQGNKGDTKLVIGRSVPGGISCP